MIRLIQDDDMVAIVLLNESELHLSGKVYPVLWVGYGEDIMMYCSDTWVEDQKIIEEIDYQGETDFDSLYENIILKRT